MPEETVTSPTQHLVQGADRLEAADQQRRAAGLTWLIRIAVVAIVVTIGSYLALYAQAGAWQILVNIAGLALGLLGLVPTYHFARRRKLDPAGYWALFTVLVIYGAGELVWDDATVHLTISALLFLILTGMVILPRRWGLWLVAAILYAGYVLLINQVEPLPRYPILDSAPIVQAINIPLALVVLGQGISLLRRGTIRARLTLALVVIVLVPVAAIYVVTNLIDEEVGRQRVFDQLESVATLKAAEISRWLETLQSDLGAIMNRSDTARYADEVLVEASSATSDQLSQQKLEEILVEAVRLTDRLEELYLLNLDGQVVLSTDSAQEGQFYGNEPFFKRGLENPYIQPLSYSFSFGGMTLIIARPQVDADGQTIGVLAGRFHLAPLDGILLERAGLGETGETYLVDTSGLLLTASRFEGYTPGESYLRTEGIKAVTKSRTAGFGEYEGYRGTPVVGVYRWLPELHAALLAEQDQAEAFEVLVARRVANITLSLAAVVIAIAASFFITRGIARPLADLAHTAGQIASGNLDIEAKVKRHDEIGALAQAFNGMTAQLRDLVATLEIRVEERTRELETVAELGRAVTGLRDLRTLLPLTVDFIQQRTGFYHVQIFLVDPEGQYAVLRAGTGEVGVRLLEAGHRLAVGSDSVIGQVVKRGEPVIALDTADAQVAHRPNPFLPDTRSEMALPLRIERRVIGALDVQSEQPNAFDEDDMRVFQLLADQLAVAIDSAMLLRESEARLREIDSLNRRLVGDVWADYLRRRRVEALGAEANEREVVPQAALTPGMAEAIRSRQTVSLPTDGGQVVALPVVFRDVALGALEFEVEGDTVDAETLSLAQALADRLALSLDNVRLTERSQRMAQRERIVNEISGKLTGKTDMAEILQTAVRELGQALRAPDTAIQLMPTPGHDSDQGNGAGA